MLKRNAPKSSNEPQRPTTITFRDVTKTLSISRAKKAQYHKPLPIQSPDEFDLRNRRKQ